MNHLQLGAPIVTHRRGDHLDGLTTDPVGKLMKTDYYDKVSADIKGADLCGKISGAIRFTF